jgi:hypothetical protein
MNNIFYNESCGKILSPGKLYYTLLSNNMKQWSNYLLVEIENTIEYVGVYFTGFHDSNCGHYIFSNNGIEKTIPDDYNGRRAFFLAVLMLSTIALSCSSLRFSIV